MFWASPNIVPSSLSGGTYTELMHAADWMPTLLDGIGIDINSLNVSFDGVSQWKGLTGVSSGPFREDVFYGNDDRSGSCPPNIINYGYQTRGYKLLNSSGGCPQTWYAPVNDTIHSGDGDDDDDDDDTYTMHYKSMKGIELRGIVNGMNLSLYNLSVDPYETTDISMSNVDIVNELYEAMADLQKTGVPPAHDDPNCTSNIPHPVYPVVGAVWEPWC